MSVTKAIQRKRALLLAGAALAGIVFLAGRVGAQDASPAVPDKVQPRADIRIEAPMTRVEVDSKSGRTHVETPYTLVAVDPDGGSVRVRVPFLSLDIRW
jgi:hypothetical protein